MKLSHLLLTALVALSCSLALAEEKTHKSSDPEDIIAEEFGPEAQSKDNDLEDDDDSDESIPNLSESWYTYWGVGIGQSSYSDPRDVQLVDRLQGNSETKRMAFSADLLGLYWPLKGNRTLVGGIINAMTDIYRDALGGVRMTQVQVGPSMMHFFKENAGDGFFVRADVGYVLYNVLIESSDLRSSYPDHTASGLGLLLGIGYGLPLRAGETRLLFNLNYAYRMVPSAVRALGLSVGLLF